MAGDPLFQPLETLLNRNIAGSSRARELTARLDGRALEVRVSATPIRIRFEASGGALSVGPGGGTDPDAIIEGMPLALASLAGPGAEDRIRGGSVRIRGDAEVAQSFRKLFEAARPDFEEELSRLVGDAAAHHLANAARGAFELGRRALSTLAGNMGEYLTEESRDLPARPEVEEWIDGVDRLREDVDRLEARLARLERARPEGDG